MLTDRRRFLVASGISALAAGRALGANDTLRIAAIGCGGRMHSLLSAAEQAGGATLVAVSDVYQPRTDEIRQRTSDTVSAHVDYRPILDRKDVDAVIIASPDHWHLQIATDALAAGKDVYLEKPVTHTLEQGEPLIKAVRSSTRILQCGMQQRSWVHFQSAVDLMQAGNIGRITQIRTYWYQNYQNRVLKPVNTDLLDWKRWLGSAPDQPFTPEKFYTWRWFWDFGAGAFTDLFTHWIDVVHWAMKSDMPQRVNALGDTYVLDTLQCPDTVEAMLRYPGFQVSYEGTMVSSIDDGGLEFRGTDATLKITRAGFTIDREGRRIQNPVLSEHNMEDGTITHMRNFFDCVRDRKQPNAPVEAGVAAARAGHLANRALRENDPKARS
jgi:predicted dehydrogenase